MASSRAGVARSVAILVLGGLLGTGLHGQETRPTAGSAPHATDEAAKPQHNSRITQEISDTVVVGIPNTTHPMATFANDRGRADASVSMERIMLLLKPSEHQQAALKKLIDSQHDPESSNYQQWLTPEQYAAEFGPSQADIERIISWLKQNNFTVGSVARGGQWIEISGTAAQVETTFHTEIHNYVVNGEKHVANATDISLPQALAPLVTGVLSLHDFRIKPLRVTRFQVHRDPKTGKLVPVAASLTGLGSKASANPEFTLPGAVNPGHLLAPGDWSRIYNTEPLLEKNITGAGISIAIVGSDSDIQLSDVRTFRQIFRLPANDPIFFVNGTDPGINAGSDAELEADLDVEWSGAVAPNATIKFVTSSSTTSTFGGFLSISYIVDNRLAPIMSVSLGACEAFLGTGGNGFLNSAFEQAAAEGISVFVASGDTGAAACDPQLSFGPAQNGPNVSGFASTPFNVAVGGTMFAENGRDADYWSANNRADLSSSLGYIPEAVWNEACDPTVDPNQCRLSNLYVLVAGSGGPSNCTQSTFQPPNIIQCQGGYPKPSWQSGTGVPDDEARDIPDVSLASAGGHDGYLVCFEGACQTTISDGQTQLQNAVVVGGTSAAAPSMAGLMALVEQKTRAYQGLINFDLYKLAAADHLSACNSSHLIDPSRPDNCIFYDVTSGNNDVPGQPGYSAGVGYDLATGLGSVNAENLVNRWASVVRKLHTVTKLSPDDRQGVVVEHGQAMPWNVVVTPASGTGVPAGDFDFMTDKFGSVFGGRLEKGRFSGNIKDLPGGDYNLHARYSGSAMYAPSDSRPIKVSIAPESSLVNVQPLYFNFADSCVPVTGPILYGQTFALQVDVHGKSGVASPSGAVTIVMDTNKVLGTFPLNKVGNVVAGAGCGSLGGFESLISTGLPPGVHTFTISYGGDNSFKRSEARPVVVTVNRASTSSHILTLQDNFVAGVPIDLLLFVATQGPEQPTGTVQLYDCGLDDNHHCPNGVPIGGPIKLNSSGVYPSMPPAAPSQALYRGSFTAGVHGLKLAYSGDVNYVPTVLGSPVFSVDTRIIVSAPTKKPANIELRQSPGTITLGQSENYEVSVKSSQAHGPVPTGTVTFIYSFAGLPLAAPVPLVNGNASFVFPWFFAGEQGIGVDYSGDANYDPLSSTMVVTKVKRGEATVTLTSGARVVEANSRSTLTVILSGGPSNPNIFSPAAEGGLVEFFDSVNGSAPHVLGPGPQPLTTANGGNSIYMLPVVLPLGENVITAQFLGADDWAPRASNPVVVTVRKADSHSDDNPEN